MTNTEQLIYRKHALTPRVSTEYRSLVANAKIHVGVKNHKKTVSDPFVLRFLTTISTVNQNAYGVVI